jgi:nitrite reductase/ring-hydroxylating ferredoxin subunit
MAIGFAGSISTMLQSCSSLPMYKTELKNEQLFIPLSEFDSNKNILLVRNNEIEFDIAVIKTDNNYKALYLQCTHQNQPLSLGDKKISCSAHGSTFSLDGKVLNGPADKSLIQYNTIVENMFIKIDISKPI